MELTDRQWQVFDYVKQMHAGQMRKYGGEPYYTHLMRVADRVSVLDDEPFLVEIALCHDLIEDTEASLADLSAQLIGLGYTVEEDSKILAAVDELTDHFIKAKFPELNRRERKKLEAKRMIGMRPAAQTVKYADVMDNIQSIVEDDPGFARVYVREVGQYLGLLDKGDPELYYQCLVLYEKCRKELDKTLVRH